MCVHCLASFLVAEDDSLQKDRTAGEGHTTTKGWYGHFEVVTDAAGQPVELGSGSMGTAYRALDTVLNRAVALKVIDRSVAGHSAARARFLREAQAAAKFHHPNVASVLFYGEEDGECFYVMELVVGETLAERVRRDGPLPVRFVLEVAIQITRALVAAEAHGIVHRDLKPGNVLLDGAGGEPSSFTVKVIDFGLAKVATALSGRGPEDTRGGFVGTPAFASPEQFVRSEDRRIDTRSDIYSLGLTLWYLLSAKLPFVGQTLDEIHVQQTRQALPWDQLRAVRVPNALTALLRSMLSAAPQSRPQSARELLAALEKCRQALPPPPESLRRRRFLLLGTSLALAALAGGWLYRITRPPPDRSLAVLPFENLSPDPADTFFTVGMQDEIAADLARVRSLRIIGSDSTRSYPPAGRDLARVGRELGVAHLLEGSLQREGSKVHVNLRLVDLHDPGHPWTKEYDRQLADVFAVQGEITRAVADRLDAGLSADEKVAVNRPPTTDLAAYDLYLRAREGPQIFKSPAEALQAYLDRIRLLEGAVARDPGFALAYCELAKAHDKARHYGPRVTAEEPAVDHRTLAETALAKARRLRPDAGEVHLALAAHFYLTAHDADQARVEIYLARQTLPNSSEVEEMAGEIARDQNRWDEAIRCLEKAVALNPRENVSRFTLANTYRLLRRYDEFDRQIEQVIAALTPPQSAAYRLFRALGKMEQRAELATLRSTIAAVSPADEPSGQLKNEYGLILALYARDADAISRILAATEQSSFQFNSHVYPRAWFDALAATMRRDTTTAHTAFAAARVEVDKMVQRDLENSPMLGLLAVIDARLGDKELAVGEALRACELPSVGKRSYYDPIVASDMAAVYAWTGEPDLACGVLEKWIERPAGMNLPAQPTYGDLCLNPLWDPLQGNLRYEKLVKRLAPPDTPMDR